MPDTKHKILQAADSLFCRAGYDGVSIRDIADHADVDKASVFYHFDDKDTLFEAILERYYTAHRRVLADALAGDAAPRDRLHDAIDAYLDFIDDHRRYPRLVQGLVTRGGDRADFVERSLTPLFDFIVDALADVTPPTAPPAPATSSSPSPAPSSTTSPTPPPSNPSGATTRWPTTRSTNAANTSTGSSTPASTHSNDCRCQISDVRYPLRDRDRFRDRDRAVAFS